MRAAAPDVRPPAGAGDHVEKVGRRDLGRDVAGAALAAALSLAVAALALHLWSWPLSVPLTHSSDALYYDAVVKGTLDHGWYLRNPDLGAPFGLDNHDFPVASNDGLPLLIVKAIGLFTDRPFLASNLFFVLTFPLNAVGAFVALRWRRVSRDLAVLGAAVFGVLPLSFMKGKDYLFFVSFGMVALGCALVLTVLADEPLFRRRPDVAGRARPWLSPRSALVVLLCAAIASASIYYAMFTALLLGTAALARGLVSRSRQALAGGLAAVVAIATFVVVNQLPTILYRLQHGPNPLVATRDPAETEFYGLRLIQLVLPIPGHRFAPFANLTDRYDATARLLGEPQNAIGLLATIGLGWLLVVALTSMLGAPRRRGAGAIGEGEERHAAFLVVVALLWATTGGLSAIVSYTLTPQFRAWSRMSVYIAFLSVLGLTCLLERGRRRLRAPRPIAVAVLTGLFLVAALDQTSPRFAPRAATRRAHASDVEFVRRIEAGMPPGTAILQLPYVAYPEVPAINRLRVYDELRPYLVSKELRWSYGAMKGRPEDWHAALTDLPLRSLVAAAVASGLHGVVVDRFGYADGGAALEAELVAIAGPPTVLDRAGRLAFWDLRPLEERLRRQGARLERLADVGLRPVRLTWGREFFPEEGQGGARWRWTGNRGVVIVDNPADEARQVILSVTVRTGRPGTGSTTLRLPDGSTETVRVGPEGAAVRRAVRVPAGASTLEVESTAEPAALPPGDRRRLVVQLVDAVVVPVELCEAAVALGAPGGEGGCLESSRAHRPS